MFSRFCVTSDGNLSTPPLSFTLIFWLVSTSIVSESLFSIFKESSTCRVPTPLIFSTSIFLLASVAVNFKSLPLFRVSSVGTSETPSTFSIFVPSLKFSGNSFSTIISKGIDVQTQIQDHMIIQFSDGRKVNVDDEYVFRGSDVGIDAYDFGQIKKNGQKYIFISNCYFQIHSNDENIKLNKGKSVEIKNNMELYVSVKPSKKIKFTL